MNKSVAASAALVKEGKKLVNNVRHVTALQDEVDWADLAKRLDDVRPINATIEKLTETKENLKDVKEIKSELEKAKDELCQWADKVLCPQVKNILDNIATQLDKEVVTAGMSHEEKASAFTGKPPPLPTDATPEFLTRCDLAGFSKSVYY